MSEDLRKQLAETENRLRAREVILKDCETKEKLLRKEISRWKRKTRDADARTVLTGEISSDFLKDIVREIIDTRAE